MFAQLKIPTRQIANITQNNHGRSTARSVITRYRRTGAGFWFRVVPGRRKKLWQNLFYQRTHEGVPISNGASKHLPTFGDRVVGDQMSLTYDLMVHKYYRQQRWTVSNAYEGHDRYSKMWYYPGREDEDPSTYEKGHFSHHKAWENKASYSYDNDNAYYEYCVNQKPKTYFDGCDKFHLEDMKKTVARRNKRLVPK